MTPPSMTRRECLGLVGAGCAAGLAGCTGGDTASDPDTTTSPTDDGRTQTATATGDEAISVAATVNGLVAEYDPAATSSNESEIRSAVAEAIDGARRNVRVDDAAGVVEVRADADPSALVAALDDAGADVDADAVRRGVTRATLDRTVEVLSERLTEAGHENATVTAARNGTQVRVDVPGAERSATVDLVERRGRVAIVASFPGGSGDGAEQREESVITQGDFARVGPVRSGGGQPPYVPVTLTDEAATRFTDAMTEYGFTDEGVGSCRWQDDREDPGYCLYTVVDGEVQYAAGVAPSLAEAFRNGEFSEDPRFRMTAVDAAAARALKRNLESGALPTTLEVDAE